MYGIITFHRALNAGAVLQCYALSRYLHSIGMPNIVLDYRNSFIERQHHPFTLYRGAMLKCAARAVILGPVLATRVKKFDAFVKTHIKLSRPYMSIDELNAEADAYTAFITGSDQVFSDDCAQFDAAYFLDFPQAADKKFSYAASFGSNKLKEDLKQEYFARLSGYPFLSLREEAGAKLAKEQLQLKFPVESHIDPVMLLEAGDWMRIAKKPPQQEYIFLYTMLPSDTIFNKASELGKQTGLPVLWADDKYYRVHRGIKHRLAVAPDELLGYIAGASYVVTNSFHGTAFALLFERRLIIEAASAKGSRVANLLALLGLESKDLQQAGAEIDWAATRRRLENERQRTAEYFAKIRGCGGLLGA